MDMNQKGRSFKKQTNNKMRKGEVGVVTNIKIAKGFNSEKRKGSPDKQRHENIRSSSGLSSAQKEMKANESQEKLSQNPKMVNGKISLRPQSGSSPSF